MGGRPWEDDHKEIAAKAFLRLVRKGTAPRNVDQKMFYEELRKKRYNLEQLRGQKLTLASARILLSKNRVSWSRGSQMSRRIKKSQKGKTNQKNVSKGVNKRTSTKTTTRTRLSSGGEKSIMEDIDAVVDSLVEKVEDQSQQIDDLTEVVGRLHAEKKVAEEAAAQVNISVMRQRVTEMKRRADRVVQLENPEVEAGLTMAGMSSSESGSESGSDGSGSEE